MLSVFVAAVGLVLFGVCVGVVLSDARHTPAPGEEAKQMVEDAIQIYERQFAR